MKMLFVCTGNTCRSPMAEHLARSLARAHGVAPFEAVSAGITPATHMDFPEEARIALRKEGVDVADHKAKPVTEELISAADVVLAMEERHRQYLLQIFPSAKKKTFLLKEYAGVPGPKGIADPIGRPLDVYQETLAEIKLALVRVFQKLKS